MIQGNSKPKSQGFLTAGVVAKSLHHRNGEAKECNASNGGIATLPFCFACLAIAAVNSNQIDYDVDQDIPLIAFCAFDTTSVGKRVLVGSSSVTKVAKHLPFPIPCQFLPFCRHCLNRNPRLQRIQWRSSNSSWRALHRALPHIRPGA